MALNSFHTSGNSPGKKGSAHARCAVGLLGFGTVGTAIALRLTGPDSPSAFQLTHICDRRAREKRARQSEPLVNLTWTDRFDDLLTSQVDVIVEAVSVTEPAFDHVRAALLAGKSVVTVNKQVVAHHGPALLSLAERQGRQLRFEGAVGGAMPIVRALGEGFAGDRVLRLDAILSGTTNAVLSRMDETSCGMDEAVAEACARGYADADPSADLEGADAATKLVILCALAFGLRVNPSAIETRSTAGLQPDDFVAARERQKTIRQVAHAEYDRARGVLTAWVRPMFVPRTSLFARVVGPQNAAIITGAHAGEVTLTGIGAGGDAIAVAALADLVTIARDRAAIVPAPILDEPRQISGLTTHKFAEAV